MNVTALDPTAHETGSRHRNTEAMRSSRKHRSSNDNTRLQCTQRQRSEGMREAPYYHATLGTDSLKCVAKRANSALGATEIHLIR